MTTRLLLKLALRALNEIPNHSNVFGLPEATGKFSGHFSSYDLAAEIDRHFKETAGFTVILAYPEDDGQTYSGGSSAKTWEEAVVDVAAQMRDDSRVIEFGDEVTIVDVFEGQGDHDTFPNTDRGALVRFRKSGPVLLDHTAHMLECKYLRILDKAQATMHGSDLEPTSALKQAASDEGIPDGDEMGAFVAWANEEWFGKDTNAEEADDG